MAGYSHRERLQMILAGEKPDRFAASFWRHFFHKEHSAEGTAEAMLHFQEQFDWDFMKINPRADYHSQGWGVKLAYSHDEFKKHVKSDFPVTVPADWRRIEPLKLTSPALDEHLKAVSIIRKKSSRHLPVLMTVFSPIAVAGRLVANPALLAEHLRNHEAEVLPAIEAIAQTFEAFSAELRNAGADGLFYATTLWASSNLLTWPEYNRIAVPFDKRLLKAAGPGAINLIHVCSSNNFLRQIAEQDYAGQMYNWDSADPTNTPVDRSFDLLKGKTVVGGVDHEGWLRFGTPEEIRHKMDEIKSANDPARLIIGPGCAIPPEVPMNNLKAIRERL